MVDVRFSSDFGIRADTGSYVPPVETRIYEDTSTRLSWVEINAKDWGAVGNGVADDHDALAAAINFAVSTGCRLYIPPGTYLIGKSGTAKLHIAGTVVGAGRDVTILKGSYALGTLAPSYFDGASNQLADPRFLCWTNENQLWLLADLTIWNDSQVDGAGAYFLFRQAGEEPTVSNCHFHGVVGLNASAEAFGTVVNNCLCTCSRPPSLASDPVAESWAVGTLNPAWSATKFPPPGSWPSSSIAGSVGMYVPPGECINNRVEGFDVGFAVGSASGPNCIGNRAYRCNAGVSLGLTADQTASYFAEDAIIQSFVAERCMSGVGLSYVGHVTVAASDLCAGAEGPYERASIVPGTGMSWSSTGGGTVTVQTSAAHNLSSGTRIRLFVTPSAWAPSDGVVTVTVTDSTHFTFPLANPGVGFTSGSWNQIAWTLWSSWNSGAAAVIANTSSAPFDVRTTLNGDAVVKSVIMSVLASGGWTLPVDQSNPKSKAGWELIMCGKGGSSPPIPWLHFSELPSGNADSTSVTGPYEGQEFNIVNGAGAGTFGSVVTDGGGGGSRWKVRYDSSNWVRVG